MDSRSAKPELVNDELVEIQTKIASDRPLDVYDVDALKRMGMKGWEETNNLFCHYPGCDWVRQTVFPGETSPEAKKGNNTLAKHIMTGHWYWKLAHMPYAQLSTRFQPPPKPEAKTPRKKSGPKPARFDPYAGRPVSRAAAPVPRSVPFAGETSTTASTESDTDSGLASLSTSSWTPLSLRDLAPPAPPIQAPIPEPTPIAPLNFEIGYLTTAYAGGVYCTMCGHFEPLIAGRLEQPEQQAMQAHIQGSHFAVRQWPEVDLALDEVETR